MEMVRRHALIAHALVVASVIVPMTGAASPSVPVCFGGAPEIVVRDQPQASAVGYDAGAARHAWCAGSSGADTETRASFLVTIRAIGRQILIMINSRPALLPQYRWSSPAHRRTAPAPLFVPGLVAIALLAVACSSGSDAPSNGTGLAGTTGNAGTGGASTGGRGGSGGGGAGTTGDGGNAGSAAGGAGLGGGPGTGGVGGSSGGTGGSSDAGAAGTGGGMTTAPTPSAGCSKTATQTLNQWVAGTLTVSGTSRTTAVRLPTGYDPNRAYPVIVLLHGCGSGTNNVPMENATGSNAILVRGTGSASGTCWSTTASGADVALVDAMIADVKARFCADEGRIFTVGYSSGSWLVNQLTCIRASVLRGAATVTGGEAASGNCGGPVARMFVHDMDDTDNVISGSEKARDRQLTQNGCDKSMAAVPTDPSPCVRYPGCPAAYPVVWCATSGQKHNRQDNWVPAAFWNFFKAF